MNCIALGTILDHITKSELQKIKIVLPTQEIMGKIGHIMRESVKSKVMSRKFLNDVLKEVEKLNEIK